MYKLIEAARFCPDVRATTEFYSRLFGVPPAHQYEGMSEFQQGDVTLRVHKTYKAKENDLLCEDHIAFGVENLEQSCREAETRGLNFEVPPREYPWGKSAYLRDPDGRLVELHESPSG